MRRAGRTIPLGACPDTSPHLEEFDRGYIREYSKKVIMRRPIDTRAHPVLNYVGKLKMVEEARGINPYAVRKDLGIDYRFQNEFHSNFYATAILASKKTKIIKMQYIDWDEMQEKEEPEFDANLFQEEAICSKEALLNMYIISQVVLCRGAVNWHFIIVQWLSL